MTGTKPFALLSLGVGFTIWSLAFVLIYAVLSWGCEAGWDMVGFGPVSLLRAILLALVAAAGGVSLLAAGVLARRSSSAGRSTAGFLSVTASVAALMATAAVFFTFSGVVSLSPCS